MFKSRRYEALERLFNNVMESRAEFGAGRWLESALMLELPHR
jgi:hypothetical protein